MENVTFLATGENFTTFLLVLVALAGLFILFANVVEAARKLFKPKSKEKEDLDQRQTACDRKFANDQQMLIDHDKRTSLEIAFHNNIPLGINFAVMRILIR